MKYKLACLGVVLLMASGAFASGEKIDSSVQVNNGAQAQVNPGMDYAPSSRPWGGGTTTVFLQGGDDCTGAVDISGPLPVSVSGTTVGFRNDYDEVCPVHGQHVAGRGLQVHADGGRDRRLHLVPGGDGLRYEAVHLRERLPGCGVLRLQRPTSAPRLCTPIRGSRGSRTSRSWRGRITTS